MFGGRPLRGGLRILWCMAGLETMCGDGFCPGTNLNLKKNEVTSQAPRRDRRRVATGAAGRRRGEPRQTWTTGDPLEGKSAMALCDAKSGAESGLPTLPEILGGNSATAAQVWKETDLGEPAGTQTLLLMAKIPPIICRQ
jgi:hypothetical protein